MRSRRTHAEQALVLVSQALLDVAPRPEGGAADVALPREARFGCARRGAGAHWSTWVLRERRLPRAWFSTRESRFTDSASMHTLSMLWASSNTTMDSRSRERETRAEILGSSMYW